MQLSLLAVPIIFIALSKINNRNMGLVHAQIELVNTKDVLLSEEGYIKSDEIRKMNLEVLVDTGAYMFCINETIKLQLGLKVIGHEIAELANGHKETYEIVGPVTINFANRQTICRAFVLPGDSVPLLGAIPMEDMDVLVHPRTQQLLVNPDHPNIPQKSLR